MAYRESTHAYGVNNTEFRIQTVDDGAGNPVPADFKIRVVGDDAAQKLGSGQPITDFRTYVAGPTVLASNAHVLGPFPVGGLVAGGNAVRLNPGTGRAGKVLRGVDDPLGFTVGDLEDEINDGSQADQDVLVWGTIAFTDGSSVATGYVEPPDGTAVTGKRGRILRIPVFIDRAV